MDLNVLFPDLLETHGIRAPTSHLEDRDLFRRDYWAALRPLGAILSSARAETICRPQPGRDRRRTPTPALRRTPAAISGGRAQVHTCRRDVHRYARSTGRGLPISAPAIPAAHSVRLIALGYMVDFAGRLRMTMPGRIRMYAGQLAG